MTLIGMFDSPYVRRVAVSLRLLSFEFEHRNWSVGQDFEQIRKYNPLGRVPALVLDDGEVLTESGAILDWADEAVGPGRALLPPSGIERRHALQVMGLATSSADKGVAQLYERAFRPREKHHEPWIARCRTQVEAGLDELNKICSARQSAWLLGPRLTQADITVTAASTFLIEALPMDATRWPALNALRVQTEQLPAFREFHQPFFAPKTG